MNVTLEELAKIVGGTVVGDGGTVIQGVNGIKEAGPGEITFLANPKYAPLLALTRASAVILADGVKSVLPAIRVRNPDLAFAQVIERFVGAPPRPPPGIHPAAVVSPEATIGKGVAIGACAVVEAGAAIGDGAVLYPQVYVGHRSRIGPGCLLYPQVVVRERCELGARVILHGGTVIGADGFGYVTEDGVHKKIPQTGIVVIEDDVEIGANVTVDRARFDKTVIKKGTKIDNLVQIAHNVVVGEGSLIAAQAGIAGSTKVGKHVMIAGQAGIVGHLEVGDQAIITAQSGVTKSVPPKTTLSGGYHATDQKTHLKEMAALRKLPVALAEIKRLKKELEELKRKAPSS